MDARAELIHIGRPAIPVVIDGLMSLGRFGRLTAIEVFEAVRDVRCGPALTGLLVSEESTEREWAAVALADLGIRDAVGPLWDAYRACVRRATPPDLSEPVAFRAALTDLGARHPVLPASMAGLRTTAPRAIGPAWPAFRCEAIVNALADLEQVVLNTVFWSVDGDATHLVHGPQLDWDLDWTSPWPELVESAREWALLEASETPAGENIVATVEWIDRTDLHL